MVRGPAAVLAAAAVALAYVLAAGSLPSVGDGDGAVLVGGCCGLVAVALVTLTTTRASDTIAAAVLLAIGGGLLAGALDDAGIDAGAIVPEAIFAGAVGTLLARWLLAYAGAPVALAVPVFVALVDICSVAIGPTSRLADGDPRGAAVLAFDLPSWGDAFAGPAARLGLPDAIFLAAFATWTARLRLRRRSTIAAMICGLTATLAISVTTSTTIPALPALALGFLLPNADRLAALVRAAPRG